MDGREGEREGEMRDSKWMGGRERGRERPGQ